MTSSHPSNSNFAAQNDEDLDSAELLKLRKKCGRFRILVIGRANAGKTTLCQMMCNTDKPPIVYDRTGNRIDMSPGHERGIHDINNEITYEANPGFVFHDSGGFESGSNDELEVVRAFIKARSEETALHRQLHAIWICLPVDDDRPLLNTEMEFFREGTDSVPVIAIFTKCDARNVKANRELRDEGIVNRKDLKEQTQLRVESYLGGLADHIKQEAICKPKGLIFLKDMHKGFNATTQAQCSELVAKTSQSIDRKVLKLLLVTVQQCNMKICIEYAINDFCKHERERERERGNKMMDTLKRWIPGVAKKSSKQCIKDLTCGNSQPPVFFKNDIIWSVREMVLWFPHFYYDEPYDDGERRRRRLRRRLQEGRQENRIAEQMVASLEQQLGMKYSQKVLLSYLLGCIIITESSFWCYDKIQPLSVCLEDCTSTYLQSQQMISVTNGINKAQITTMGHQWLPNSLTTLALNNLLDIPKTP